MGTLKQEKNELSRYMAPELVGFFTAKDRDEALRQMVELADQAGRLQAKEPFYQAILNREQLVSTGIGMGIAIPHAKIAGYTDFFIAIGIFKEGIDWSSLDGVAVRILFMIGGPDDKQTQYLKILSALTHLLKDEERRKIILGIEEGEDIYKTIAEF